MAMPTPRENCKAAGSFESEPAHDMPEMLGEYQLLEALGEGGMGQVYKALHTKLDRVVAIKVLCRGRVGDRQAITRFTREMKAVGRLAHPNIVQAHDARNINDTPVLIMEYVDGLDLAEIVRRLGRLPIAESCELVRCTALALQCAHEHGLVHRDVKPSNIMLARSGQVKLLDLGLARFYAEDEAGVAHPLAGEEMTGTGQAMGTADYMAPEQASDSRSVDIRADIYSLGCTLYKLLGGRAPFSGPQFASGLEKMHAHLHHPVPPIGDLVAGIPEQLATVLSRMLAKELSGRSTTPAEVATAMEPFCPEANLVDLIQRAMVAPRRLPRTDAISESPLSPRVSPRESATASVPRSPILRRVLVGLGFFGAIVAAFAAGIVITIQINKDKYQVVVPGNSQTGIDNKGNVTVTIPLGSENAKTTSTSAAAESKAFQTPKLPETAATQGTGAAPSIGGMASGGMPMGSAGMMAAGMVPMGGGMSAGPAMPGAGGDSSGVGVMGAGMDRGGRGMPRAGSLRGTGGGGRGPSGGTAIQGQPVTATPAAGVLPEVGVIQPVARRLFHHKDFIGRMEALQTVEVRARITGTVTKIAFTAGTIVKKGDPLFAIDAAPFQAETDKREAEMRLTEFRLERATTELKVAKAPTASDRQRLVAQQAEAEAAMKAAQQALKVAQLNLKSTQVTAPISGKIGRPLVPVGGLVADATPLAVIDTVDPICAAFDVDESTVLDLRRNPPRVDGRSDLPVLIALADERGYPHKSKVESADTRIDPAKGNACWRALLPNPDGFLMPGMSVRIRLVTSDPYDGLLLPRDVFNDPSMDRKQLCVFVVTDQGIVQRREVQIGVRDDDGLMVVDKGLTGNDWVISRIRNMGGTYMEINPGRSGPRLVSIEEGMKVKPQKNPPAAPPSDRRGRPALSR
jgi:RND family efflux transporter MFP subunit